MNNPQAEQLLQEGLQHHRAGRLAEAETAYRQILQLDPNHVDALNFLGVIAGQAGRADDAISLIRRAITIQPNEYVFYFNLATALRQAGRNSEAMDAYRRGLSLHQDPSALVEMGRLSLRAGQMQEAHQSFTRALALDPNLPTALHAMGTLYMQSNQFAEAADILKRAVDRDPTSAPALRDLTLAIARLDTALEDPRIRGIAETYLQRTLELPCISADDWFVSGVALNVLSRSDEAHEAFSQSLQRDPNLLPARLNLGVTASLLGRNDLAMDCYRQVMAAQPNAPLGHVAYGMSLLFAGKYAEGWPEYAWRWKSPPPAQQPRSYPEPQWSGESLDRKTLLLYGEQGFGDTINFVRYAALCARRGARVILQVPEQLIELMRSVSGVDQVISEDEPTPGFDLHAPLMDLPMAFGTTLETIPAEVPYLGPTPESIEQWSARLAADESTGRPALRVGLAWSGNPQRHHNRLRSIPLQELGALARFGQQGVNFINLQKGPAGKHSPPPGLHLRDYTDDLRDFNDTAALMKNLDLIITIDTVISHLAGAMALPVWTLLSLGPDWRYMAERQDNPWYPTMRLFRQTKWNDWSDVVRQVADALQQRISEGR